MLWLYMYLAGCAVFAWPVNRGVYKRMPESGYSKAAADAAIVVTVLTWPLALLLEFWVIFHRLIKLRKKENEE